MAEVEEFKHVCLLTVCAGFWNICGLETADVIGTVFSMTGDGDLRGTDLGRSCSGLFALDCCRTGDGERDTCGSIGFFSREGGGTGDGSFWTLSCGEDVFLFCSGDSAFGWSLTGESTRLGDGCFAGEDFSFGVCCWTGDDFSAGEWCLVGEGCLAGGWCLTGEDSLTGDWRLTGEDSLADNWCLSGAGSFDAAGCSTCGVCWIGEDCLVGNGCWTVDGCCCFSGGVGVRY